MRARRVSSTKNYYIVRRLISSGKVARLVGMWWRRALTVGALGVGGWAVDVTLNDDWDEFLRVWVKPHLSLI